MKNDKEIRHSELQFWDGIASGYVERGRPSVSTLSFPFAMSSDRCFLESLGDIRGRMVLDVGCGFGDLTVILTDLGATVCGLDLSESMIKVGASRAKRFNSDAEFAVSDAQLLPFTNDSFDIVVAMRAIHHFPDIPGFLKEVHRVLKPGGKAVFIEPQKWNPIVELNRKVLHQDLHSKHEHALTSNDIRAAKTIFPKMKTRVFYLVSPAAFLFDRVLKNKVLYEKSYKGLQKIEESAGRLSSLSRYYWQVLIELEKDGTTAREG